MVDLWSCVGSRHTERHHVAHLMRLLECGGRSIDDNWSLCCTPNRPHCRDSTTLHTVASTVICADLGRVGTQMMELEAIEAVTVQATLAGNARIRLQKGHQRSWRWRGPIRDISSKHLKAALAARHDARLPTPRRSNCGGSNCHRTAIAG